MRANLERGLFAAEAARLALAEDVVEPLSTPAPVTDATELAASLDRFDEVGAQHALDRLFATLTIDVVLRDVLLPYLHELGERWEDGDASIAQEHFASNVLRGRLTSLARGWDRGAGPRALLACVEGERHDLPLVGFGLVLRGHGWRISYLGAETPVASIVEAARELLPDAVVVSGTVGGVFDAVATKLREIALHAPLYLAGGAANGRVARRAHATLLGGDVVAAAEMLAAERR
jgi:methanogenic corrinoid protein MtbC1